MQTRWISPAQTDWLVRDMMVMPNCEALMYPVTWSHWSGQLIVSGGHCENVASQQQVDVTDVGKIYAAKIFEKSQMGIGFWGPTAIGNENSDFAWHPKHSRSNISLETDSCHG